MTRKNRILVASFFFSIFFGFSFGIRSETPETVLKSSEIYERERKSLKNYRVFQEIRSEIKNSEKSFLEKRKQYGYFLPPDRFLFFLKERNINGQNIPIKNQEYEKSSKKDIVWISKEGLEKHSFSFLEEDEYSIKFLVLPKVQFQGSHKGEIWIRKQNLKILRMIKEPTIKSGNIEEYKTEIFFDLDLPYQEPSFTKLRAIYFENGVRNEIRVEALFSGYEFNVDLTKMKN